MTAPAPGALARGIAGDLSGRGVTAAATRLTGQERLGYPLLPAAR